MNASTYHDLYEAHARALPPETSIGAGEYDTMGKIMLSALLDNGLRPSDTVLDFGCGTGRLAKHLVPHLASGRYVGVDISESMLDAARRTIERVASPDHRWSLDVQRGLTLPMPDDSVDVMCAFSVFTHMEHEDTYRYLVDARRVVRPTGRFVFSVLTLDLAASRDVFLRSAELDLDERWRHVRNVVTTYEFIEALARLAGWTVERWCKGDDECIPFVDDPSIRCALGQSICVLA